MSSLSQPQVHVAQGGGCLQSLLGGSEGLQCSGSRSLSKPSLLVPMFLKQTWLQFYGERNPLSTAAPPCRSLDPGIGEGPQLENLMPSFLRMRFLEILLLPH